MKIIRRTAIRYNINNQEAISKHSVVAGGFPFIETKQKQHNNGKQF